MRKILIKEVKQLQKIAGLLTESEYSDHTSDGHPDDTSMPAEMNEVVALKLKGYYQVLDAGMNEWNDDYQYVGEIGMGSSVGEVGEHMFVSNDAPGSFIFVSVPDADLDTMVKPSINEASGDFQAFGGFHSDEQLKDIEDDLKIHKSTDPEVWKEYILKLKSKGYDKPTHKENPHYKWALSRAKAMLKMPSLNETLEPHAFERMDQLSNEKAKLAMIKAAEILMRDLTDDGFEVEEVREFFTQLISNDSSIDRWEKRGDDDTNSNDDDTDYGNNNYSDGIDDHDSEYDLGIDEVKKIKTKY